MSALAPLGKSWDNIPMVKLPIHRRQAREGPFPCLPALAALLSYYTTPAVGMSRRRLTAAKPEKSFSLVCPRWQLC